MLLVFTVYAPSGTLNKATENIWIDATSFIAYLHHFEKFLQLSKSNPVLIIRDGHTRTPKIWI